jgi:hypothetical protein
LRREAVDPQDELVEIAAESVGRQEHQAQNDSEEESDPEGDEVAATSRIRRPRTRERPGTAADQAGRVAQ